MTDTELVTVRVYYQTVTEESAAEGDYADSGEYDTHELQRGDCDPDEPSDTPVSWAVRLLRNNGATEPSSWPWTPGTWYITPDSETDYSTGDETTYSFHLEGFTEDEQRKIYREVSITSR